MGSDSLQDRLLSQAESLVRRKIRSLVGRYGIVSDDLDDIKQELLLDLLNRAGGFDPDSGSEIQYVSTVLRNGIARLLERRKAQKRGAGFTHVSLDDEYETKSGESLPLHEVVDKQTYLAATRGPVDPDVDRLEAEIDFERICSDLLLDEYELLALLLTCTASEASRELGIPRTTLNDRASNLLAHLRKTKKWG